MRVIEDVLLSPIPTLLISSDVEVSPTRTRRRFTAAFKQHILDAAAACSQSGELGALLRREGLYSSHLAAWRTAARRGKSLVQRRGPKPTAPDPSAKRIAELERQLSRATARAERAETIVALQKKVSELLQLALPANDARSETP